VIAANGIRMLRLSVRDLMDRSPETAMLLQIETAALSTDGVQRIEKLRVRKFGLAYYVDLHVQADPQMSLQAAHVVSGKVKAAIRRVLPAAQDVLVHMEPFEPERN
jgi:divalent metal cation (Fe/Co/Zn/Cd) transporter